MSELNPAGSALVYSTYLGGTNSDYGQAIAVDGGLSIEADSSNRTQITVATLEPS